MSFRVSAIVAVAAALGLSSFTPLLAQPQPPIRPRYTQFQSIFVPGRSPLVVPGQGILGQNLPLPNPTGPQAPGFVYPQTAPTVFAIDPTLPATGVVGTFNNLGHWYPNYGHWYPNGIASGRGVLGYGGGGAVVPVVGAGGMVRPGGSLGGAALGVGATIGTFRR
jgi:hypothetical protein